MPKKKRIADLPRIDRAERLDSETAIAECLNSALADPALLAAALGDIVLARGIDDIAKAAGIPRDDFCNALRPDAHPRCDTIAKVCAALGVRLVAQPIHA